MDLTIATLTPTVKTTLVLSIVFVVMGGKAMGLDAQVDLICFKLKCYFW